MPHNDIRPPHLRIIEKVERPTRSEARFDDDGRTPEQRREIMRVHAAMEMYFKDVEFGDSELIRKDLIADAAEMFVLEQEDYDTIAMQSPGLKEFKEWYVSKWVKIK